MKLSGSLYQRLASTDLSDDSLRSRETLLGWMLFGLFGVAALGFAGSFMAILRQGVNQSTGRMAGLSLIMAVLIAFHYLVKRQRSHRLMLAISLSALFLTITTGLYVGGILTSTGLLLLSLVVVGLSTLLVEMTLARASLAETALQKQNEDLEIKIKARTRELEKEQLERMQHMYRFAELGHVSTALFHDLANHLSSVSLDIENLHHSTQPELLERIDDNIRYIDTIVQRVRSQLQGKVKIETFDIRGEIREVAKVSAITANRAGVKIKLKLPKGPAILFDGDTLKFRQVIINLLSNAVEAYKDVSPAPAKPSVDVMVKTDKRYIVIEVTDHGPGIPIKNRESIFDPFYTSKDKGVGIGLFIVRQVVDRDLKGDVRLAKTGPGGTTFAVKLPLKNRLGDQKENKHAH